MSHLNPRQERFCQAFVTGASAAAAAREAGYTARSCHSQASRLLKKNRIRRRVADIQAAIGRETGLDRDQLIGKLETVYRRAIADHNYHAATRAVELQSRLAGLLRHGTAGEDTEPDEQQTETADAPADNLQPFPAGGRMGSTG